MRVFSATEKLSWGEARVLAWKMIPKIDSMLYGKRPKSQVSRIRPV
jgi:hypothetical protein